MSFAFAPALLASHAAVGVVASRGGVSKRSKTRARRARVGAAGRRRWGVVGLEGPRGVCFAGVAVPPFFPIGGLAKVACPRSAVVDLAPNGGGLLHGRRKDDASSVVAAEREISACHRDGSACSLAVSAVPPMMGRVARLQQRRDEDA